MTIAMPKFDLKKKGDVTDAEVAAASQKSKYLQPGNHDVKVESLVATGPSAKDPTWFKVQVNMVGANGGAVRETVLIPTVSCKYNAINNPKGALFLYSKLQAFFRAVGEEMNGDNVYFLCDKYFGKGKLTGTALNLDIGYKGNHAKFIKEGEFQLVDRDDQPYRDKAGVIPTFASRDEVEAYSAENGLAFQKYSEILKFTPKHTEVADDAEDTTEF